MKLQSSQSSIVAVSRRGMLRLASLSPVFNFDKNEKPPLNLKINTLKRFLENVRTDCISIQSWTLIHARQILSQQECWSRNVYSAWFAPTPSEKPITQLGSVPGPDPSKAAIALAQMQPLLEKVDQAPVIHAWLNSCNALYSASLEHAADWLLMGDMLEHGISILPELHWFLTHFQCNSESQALPWNPYMI